MKKGFGAYSILNETTHNFSKETEWYWKIKPITSGDELSMQKFMVNYRSEIGPDGVQRTFPPTVNEVMFREIALSFAGTNIAMDETKSVADGGDPFIKVEDAIEIKEAKLRQMPQPMVDEVWNALGDAVPGWGPYRPKAVISSES